MPENPQEQTEAKLLAYIEGELDESGRAEIERHILANPRYRKLLDELSAGRRYLRLLPREIAPVDLFEGVQSQLERQELLSSVATVPSSDFDDDQGAMDPTTGNMRLNRWGRVRAAAAIALVASGLSLLVYNIAAPKGAGTLATRGTPPEAPTKPPTTNTDSAGTMAGVLPVDPSLVARPLVTSPEAEDSRRLRLAGVAEQVSSLDEVRNALTDETRKSISTPDPRADAAAGEAERDRASDAPASDSLYLVVASGDPTSARDDVLSVLNDRGLKYNRLPITSMARARSLAESDTSNAASDANADKSAGTRGSPMPGETAAAPSAAGAGVSAEAISAAPASAPQPAPGGPRDGGPKQPSRDADAMPKSIEEVVIVRRVSRARAGEVLQAINRPASSQFAYGYVSGSRSSVVGLRQTPSTATPDDAIALKKSMARSTGPAAPDAGMTAFGVTLPAAATRPLAAAQSPAIARDPLATPADVASAATPATQPFTRAMAGQATAKTERESAKTSDRLLRTETQAGAAPAKPNATAKPATAPGTAAPTAAAQPRETRSDGLQSGAAPIPADRARGGPLPSVTAPAAPTAPKPVPAAPPMAAEPRSDLPLAANDAIELVYLDLRRNNRPVAQPMRVSAKGTIYVAGFGEFVLAGMAPNEAADRLSQAMRLRNPSSRGVEIRRTDSQGPADGLAEAGPAVKASPRVAPTIEKATPGVPPPTAADGNTRRSSQTLEGNAAGNKSAEPGQGGQIPLAQRPEPAVNAPLPSTPATALNDGDFVDLVIVVQREVGANDAKPSE